MPTISDNSLDITIVISGADIVHMDTDKIFALFTGLENLIYAAKDYDLHVDANALDDLDEDES